jgi:hypothetical protein
VTGLRARRIRHSLPAEAVWEFRRRPRCGELPRRVAIALSTARSVGAASDKPQIGVDGNYRSPRSCEENGKNSPRWPADPTWPVRGRKTRQLCPTAFEG